MACQLTRTGPRYKAATGATVTVCVKSGATNLISATYPDGVQDVPVASNCTTFTVQAGIGILLLNLMGPQDTVQIVEDCGGGQSQVLFEYDNDFQTPINIAIEGV